MKQYTKWLVATIAAMSSVVIVSSVQAQSITGTPYLSNLTVPDSSSGSFASATYTSIPTGWEVASTTTYGYLYLAIPAGLQTPLNPADNQAKFTFTFNSPAGAFAGGVNIQLFLDDSAGGSFEYDTTYANTFSGGSTYTYTYDLDPTQAANIAGGALINGISIGMDPANIPGGSYDITFNSIELVPEPASLALLGLGLTGLVALRRRK